MASVSYVNEVKLVTIFYENSVIVQIKITSLNELEKIKMISSAMELFTVTV